MVARLSSEQKVSGSIPDGSELESLSSFAFPLLTSHEIRSTQQVQKRLWEIKPSLLSGTVLDFVPEHHTEATSHVFRRADISTFRLKGGFYTFLCR